MYNTVQKCSWLEMNSRDTVSRVCTPISPALCIVLGGRDKADTSSIRFRLLSYCQCTFAPSVLDLSRADAEFFHEAGFDAYVTGYCFIMTAHLAATVNYL